MATLEELKEIFSQYETTAQQVWAKASPLAGMLGMSNDPRNHSCHEAFFGAVERWTAAFYSTNPTPEDAAQAVRFILEAAKEREGKNTYWYLYAVHGNVRSLIPLLTEEDCRQLREYYDVSYPAIDRPPVQREVYQLLRQYGGETEEPRSFLQKLFRKK